MIAQFAGDVKQRKNEAVKKVRWSKQPQIRLIFCVRGREVTEKTLIWFTIILKPHKSGDGYIIMEIMSTNVTIDTIYRGENRRITTKFSDNSHKVYIMFLLKKVEKLQQNP